jgi:hypothetical protein
LRFASEEYSIALVDNMVVDTSEYQDGYGFILKAKHQSRKMHRAISGKTRAKLENIENLWVDGVIPTTTPTPEDDVWKSISQTVEDLNTFWEDFHRGSFCVSLLISSSELRCSVGLIFILESARSLAYRKSLFRTRDSYSSPNSTPPEESSVDQVSRI